MLAGGEVGWLPAEVVGARGILLLVLDGLGWQMLQEQQALLPTLAGLAGKPITTVAPSTTAAALTSLTTGATPAEHGVVGYRMRVEATVLNVLRWSVAAEGRVPRPEAVQPVRPFLGAAVGVVTRAEFERTGFTGAHLRGGRFHGWRTEGTVGTHCRRLLAAGERLLYVYYDGVDKVAHGHGLGDEFLRDELRATDRLVAELLEALPPGYALVATADHGQVQVGAGGMIELSSLDDLVAAYAGEGRFRYLHARRGRRRELLDAARELAAGRAWVLTREELLEGGWLGPPPARDVARRVGDVVLAAREPVAFIDPGHALERQLEAMHGSLTPAEMFVPLLFAGP